MRTLTLLIALVLFALTPASMRADEAPLTIDQVNSRLERAHASLEEVQKALENPALSDSALRQLRDRLEPAAREFESAIETLTPRLAAVEARLKALAPTPEAKPSEAKLAETKPAEAKPAEAKPGETKPAEAKPQEAKPAAEAPADSKRRPSGAAPIPPRRAAPPTPAVDEKAQAESAAAAGIAAERAEQQKVYDEIDSTLKRARALLLEARETGLAIVARQRGLFAKTLFLRTDGLFSPSLWRAGTREAPAVVMAARNFLRDRGENFVNRVNSGRRIEFFFIAFLIFCAIPPALLLSRRILRRTDANATPTPLRRALGAGWTALATVAVPVAAIAALGVTLDSFDLLDASLHPIWRRLVEAVARIAFAYALARAVFAPTHPNWRLIDPGDRLARLLVRLVTLVATVMSIARLLEQIEETVQATVPVVIVTRGVSVMIITALIAVAVIALPRRVEDAEDEALRTAQGRDWVSIARVFGVLTIVLLIAACAAGYVTFANFVILQLGWTAAVGAVLYIVAISARGGVEAALAPTSMIGRNLINNVGLRREQLAPLAVLLSGLLTLVCLLVAALAALAPLGYESGDFFSNLRDAFFAITIGGVTISPSAALVAVVLFALVLTAVHALRRWLDVRFLPLTRLDVGLRNSISATLGYAGVILAAAVALSHLGLGFEKLAIVAGALSVGVGFGLQSIVNNFVSGLILLWERAIRVGDWVVVGDEQGYVKRINVRSTEIETFDRATMIVPNSNLVAGVVKNWLRGDKVGRIKIALSPHSGVDPEQMRDILISTARAQAGVLRIPAPQVMFLGMEAATFKFELWCYVEDVEQSSRVRSDLLFELHRRLGSEGVSLSAAAPITPTIVQFPSLDKVAAAAAASALALESGVLAETQAEPQEEAKT